MKYFGTDGIRGFFGRNITPELCRALAHILIKQNATLVAVGNDTRAGGVFIADIISGELGGAGATIVNFGVVSTAELSFLTVHEKADYGIMVTASHNDYKYNGIKIFNSRGEKLDRAEMELFDSTLAEMLEAGVATLPLGILRKTHKTPPAAGKEHGLAAKHPNAGDTNTSLQNTLTIPTERTDSPWCDYLCGKFACLLGWENPPYVIVDAANGAGAGNAWAVFTRLGIPFHIINDAPDGFNINADCGAVHPHGLLRAVRRHRGAALGFAFDGDADRCVAVSKRGVVHGDKLIALLSGEEERIVATKIFNPGVEDSMVAEVIKTDVGDHFVFDAMAEGGIDFGGETSGHIIDRRIWHSGDGLLTALKLLTQIKQNPRLLSTQIKIMPSLTRNLAITPADRAKLENADFGNGVIGRCSGTEGFLRITVFAKTKFRCRLRMKRAIVFAKNLIKH